MYAKYFFVVIFVALELGSSLAVTPCYDATRDFCGKEIKSELDSSSCTAEWGAFPRLNNETNTLISLHLNHSMKYLLQATHYNEWNVNRPGFHNFFTKLSDDEWNSAVSLMIYAIKRGGRLTSEFKIQTPGDLDFNHQQNEIESLSKALDLEKYTAARTLKLIHDTTHISSESGVPIGSRDTPFADFMAERLNDVSVLRIKHLANYVNMLSQVLRSSVDKAYALYTFDHQILK